MRKKGLLIYIFVLSLFPVGSIAAYDGILGVKLDAFSFKLPSILGTTFTLNQTNKLNLWYKGMWSNAAKIEVDGGVAFDMDWNFSLKDESQFIFSDAQYSLSPILNKFNFHGNSGVFGYKIGRYMAKDPGTLILNSPMDGAEFSIDTGAHIFKVGVGYTGLLFNQSTAYSLTGSDIKRSPETTLLATPRLIEYASWSMPTASIWFNPEIYFLAVQDLTSDPDLETYDTRRFHAMYLEMRTRGFLGESFIYDMAVSGQLGYYGASTILAGAGKLSFSWLPTTRIQLGVEGTAATGDEWDRLGYQLTGATGTNETSGTQLTQYLPVSTVSSRGYVVSFDLGNMISLAAFFKHSISRGFNWEFRATTLLRPAEGPVSSSLVANASQGNFIGQEFLAALSGYPSPTFRWRMKIGVLLPGDTIELDSSIKQYLPVIPRIGFDFTFNF